MNDKKSAEPEVKSSTLLESLLDFIEESNLRPPHGVTTDEGEYAWNGERDELINQCRDHLDSNDTASD